MAILFQTQYLEYFSKKRFIKLGLPYLQNYHTYVEDLLKSHTCIEDLLKYHTCTEVEVTFSVKFLVFCCTRGGL